MINILHESFPDSVRADGRSYPVQTDFRRWLRFNDLNADKNIQANEKIIALVMFLKQRPLPHITENLVSELLAFYRADSLEYRPEQDEGEEEEQEMPPIRPPVFNWCIDARYVLGDFRQFYQIDLINIDYLHWWKFMSLFAALPEESQCSKRMAYRSADLSQIKNEAEKTRIRKIQRAIMLPFEYDDEMIGDMFGGIM